MTHKFSLSIIALLAILATVPNVYGQNTASDSATVNQIRQAVKEKVNQKLEQVGRRPIGLVGIIEEITNNNVVVSVDSQKLNIATSAQTEYQKIPGRRTIERSDLAITDYVLIKGIHDTAQNSYEAETIQVIPEPQKPNRQLVTGIVTKATTSSFTLTDTEQTWIITMDKSTDIQQKSQTEELKTLKTTDIKNDDYITVVGTPDAKKTQTLKSLIILKLPSSSSATPSAEQE